MRRQSPSQGSEILDSQRRGGTGLEAGRPWRKRAFQRLAEENATIASIGRVISSTLNIKEVHERFAEEVRKLIQIDRVAITLIDPRKQASTLAYVWGVQMKGRLRGDFFALKNSVNEKIMRSREGIIIHAESIGDLKAQFPSLIPSFQAGLRSMMAVPLISNNLVIGALHFRTKKAKAYSIEDLRLAEAIAVQIAGAIANARLFRERRLAIKELRKREKELKTNSKRLEEVNAALKVLLENRERDKIELEGKVLANVQNLVLPYVEKMKKKGAGKNGIFLEIIEKNLHDIISPFIHDLKSKYLGLSPREIQVAHLIKSGNTSKQIAEILNVSIRTIDSHRRIIRKKLGLVNKNVNLISYLAFSNTGSL